jgi:hypothetical protein
MRRSGSRESRWRSENARLPRLSARAVELRLPVLRRRELPQEKYPSIGFGVELAEWRGTPGRPPFTATSKMPRPSTCRSPRRRGSCTWESACLRKIHPSPLPRSPPSQGFPRNLAVMPRGFVITLKSTIRRSHRTPTKSAAAAHHAVLFPMGTHGDRNDRVSSRGRRVRVHRPSPRRSSPPGRPRLRRSDEVVWGR